MRTKAIERGDMTQLVEIDAAGNAVRRLGSVRPTGELIDGGAVYAVNVYATRSRFELHMDRDAALGYLADRAIRA